MTERELAELQPCREWQEDVDGKPYRCKMYRMEIDGKVYTGVNRRPVVSEEEARRNNAKLCRILMNTLGRKENSAG